jgi:flagellar FliJ protein
VKRFAFRLERLRELRERAERERAAILGSAMREERDREEVLERARLELERAVTQAAALPGSAPIAAGLLQGLERARHLAEDRVDEAKAELVAASEQVEQEREQYGVARRELKVVERLKEKRHDAWREAGAREERKESDEALRHRGSANEEWT